MITNTQLGLNGDLGLNLFRVATTIATAQKFSDDYIFPEWNFSLNFPELKNKFAVPSTIIPTKVWNENLDLSYNAISNIDKTVITDLRGVFLDRRYFENAASLLRFLFKTTIQEYNYAFIHILFNQQKDLFPPLELEYYQNAISKMASIRPDIDTYLIVTDNIPKARTIFIDSKDYKFKFSTSSSQIKQLQDMASCSAGILSNSFLSFWAAFLLEDNYIISPTSWFGSSAYHKENINIFSPKWTLLKVKSFVEPDAGEILLNEPNSGPPNFKSNSFLFNTSDPIGKKADTYTAENSANKGQANGYAPLNAFRKIPITFIDTGTTSTPGLMSIADKVKLDGIANNANLYVHPNHSGDVVSTGDGATVIQPGVVDNSKIAQGIDAIKIADGTISNTEFQYLANLVSPVQTQLNDKQDLNIDLTSISNLSPNDDDLLQRKAGEWTNRSITELKIDLELDTVDNTSDVDKPISTATQIALDTKVDENTPIVGATKTKLTYDSKGLITAGTDLIESDIPTLSQSKITNLTSDLSAKEPTITAASTTLFYRGDKTFTAVPWADVSGKPSSFTPSVHATSHVTGGEDVIPNAIASGNSGLLSGSDKAKLDGIASGATANDSNSNLRDRTTHTGAQAISTITGLQTTLDSKVDENPAITGDTKTKITYDSKGLVTSGADATTADINDSTNRRYVTDSDLTKLSNLSGTNTGDQDLSGLQPLDSDLTAIAGLIPINDDILQRKAGAWTNRTPAQVKTDLALTKSDVGLGSVVNADTTTTANITDSSNKRFVTDSQLTVIGNTSGTNTGDNATNTTSNSYADGKVADLITDGVTTIAPSQNAVFDALSAKANTSHSHVIGDVTGLQTALDGKVDENSAITPGTNTKITYDAKGLVTSGTSATTADIADSTNRRYVTDAQQTVIGNTSGTNTGDNAVNSLYSGLASSKQDTLVSGTNIKTINTQSLLGSGDISISVAVADGDKGDITVSSSGTVWTIDNDTIGLDELSATGTPSAGTYLRGDNTWATVSGATDFDVDKTLSYTGDQLTSITTSLGSQTFNYDLSGKLTSIVGTGAYKSKTFTYTGDQLTSIDVA